jgi:hypothetical protein
MKDELIPYPPFPSLLLVILNVHDFSFHQSAAEQEDYETAAEIDEKLSAARSILTEVTTAA